MKNAASCVGGPTTQVPLNRRGSARHEVAPRLDPIVGGGRGIDSRRAARNRCIGQRAGSVDAGRLQVAGTGADVDAGSGGAGIRDRQDGSNRRERRRGPRSGRPAESACSCRIAERRSRRRRSWRASGTGAGRPACGPSCTGRLSGRTASSSEPIASSRSATAPRSSTPWCRPARLESLRQRLRRLQLPLLGDLGGLLLRPDVLVLLFGVVLPVPARTAPSCAGPRCSCGSSARSVHRPGSAPGSTGSFASSCGVKSLVVIDTSRWCWNVER